MLETRTRFFQSNLNPRVDSAARRSRTISSCFSSTRVLRHHVKEAMISDEHSRRTRLRRFDSGLLTSDVSALRWTEGYWRLNMRWQNVRLSNNRSLIGSTLRRYRGILRSSESSLILSNVKYRNPRAKASIGQRSTTHTRDVSRRSQVIA